MGHPCKINQSYINTHVPLRALYIYALQLYAVSSEMQISKSAQHPSDTHNHFTHIYYML